MVLRLQLRYMEGASRLGRGRFRLGAAIDGTRDEIVLCVRPLTNNADIEGSLNWRELS